jgi:hypothetical protein
MPPSTVTFSRKRLIKVLSATALVAYLLTANQGGLAQGDFLSNNKLTREERMLQNMAMGKGSVGFCILEAERNAKEASRSLGKALFQLREIEKSYAKSKGQPDTRYLSGTELKMVQAKQRSEELEGYTSDCFHDLKASIKESLTDNLLKKPATSK